MARFSLFTSAKKTALILLLVSTAASFLLKTHQVKAYTTKFSFPDQYPKITAAIENANDIENRLLPFSFFSINTAGEEASELASL